MARKFTVLFVVLVAILSLSMVLTACGGETAKKTTAATTTAGSPAATTPATTTVATPGESTPATTTVATPGDSTPATTVATPGNSTPATTTVATPGDSTPVTTTTGTPEVTTPATTAGQNPETTPATTEPTGPSETPNEDYLMEDLLYNGEPLLKHMEYTCAPGTVNGNDYDYVWRFTIKAESGHFPGTTAEDHPTHPSAPGLQLTTPVALYVKDVNNDVDYTRYEIIEYLPQEWYIMNVVAKDFVPVDGTEYDIFLVIMTGDEFSGAKFPETPHYLWNFGETWTYTAPQKSESLYFNAAQFDEIIGNRFWLLEHEPLTIDATGNVEFKFKSDGDPFSNNGEEGINGVEFTLMGDLYINGEKYDIVDGSYTTQDWYIIKFQIKDFVPEAGQDYELIFTIDGNDPTGNYCMKPDGYYALIAAFTIG